MSGSIAYAVVCVLVPLAWGLAVVAITNWLERSLGKERSFSEEPPVAQDDRV